MENKDNSEATYTALINYKICESLYLNMKKTNYQTFVNMCNNLKTAIEIKDINGDLERLVHYTANEIKILYSIPYYDTIPLIYNFVALPNETKLRYQNTVLTIRRATPNSYFEKKIKEKSLFN